jgi:hypothetical protein
MDVGCLLFKKGHLAEVASRSTEEKKKQWGR